MVVFNCEFDKDFDGIIAKALIGGKATDLATGGTKAFASGARGKLSFCAGCLWTAAFLREAGGQAG